MHIGGVKYLSNRYPEADSYPFNLRNFRMTESIDITTPVTFFIGENGTGKSTLIRIIARRCNVHIWEPSGGIRYVVNPYEEELYKYIAVNWTDGMVPGSFFVSETFQNFTRFLDEPENALSPGIQFDLLAVLRETAESGNAQVIVATHSPLLLAAVVVLSALERFPRRTERYDSRFHLGCACWVVRSAY